jgi:hypothetical protein
VPPFFQKAGSVRRSDFTYAAIANPSFSSLISEGLARFIIQMHLQMMQMQMHMQMLCPPE